MNIGVILKTEFLQEEEVMKETNEEAKYPGANPPDNTDECCEHTEQYYPAIIMFQFLSPSSPNDILISGFPFTHQQ
jgi:hypothetical protein